MRRLSFVRRSLTKRTRYLRCAPARLPCFGRMVVGLRFASSSSRAHRVRTMSPPRWLPLLWALLFSVTQRTGGTTIALTLALSTTPLTGNTPGFTGLTPVTLGTNLGAKVAFEWALSSSRLFPRSPGHAGATDPSWPLFWSRLGLNAARSFGLNGGACPCRPERSRRSCSLPPSSRLDAQWATRRRWRRSWVRLSAVT